MSGGCTAPGRAGAGGRRGPAYTRMRCGLVMLCSFRASAGIAGSADVQAPGAASGGWVGGFVWSVEEQCKVLEAAGPSVLTSPLSGCAA